MVQKKLEWQDGSRINYGLKKGTLYRYIDYSTGRKDVNAGKYYYLGKLQRMREKFDKTTIYNDIQYICEKTTSKYDERLEAELCKCSEKYGKDHTQKIKSAILFSVIYLAMLDLEENKKDYPNSLGKYMVLNSCRAVLLENVDHKIAAEMYSRRQTPDYGENILDDNYYGDCGNSYERYGGYNDFDDDTIDYGFDGFPEATWNVD